MVLIPPNRLFVANQHAAPPPPVKAPPPLFPKAVEWLDRSKPCWQSRPCFGRLFGPVDVHALAAVLPPCACISAIQIGVCFGVSVCIPRLSPAQAR